MSQTQITNSDTSEINNVNSNIQYQNPEVNEFIQKENQVLQQKVSNQSDKDVILNKKFQQKYLNKKKLGQGGQGTVILIEEKETKKLYALKSIQWDKSKNAQEQSKDIEQINYERECECLKQIKTQNNTYQNIIDIIEYDLQEDQKEEKIKCTGQIVLEYCESNLEDEIKINFDKIEALNILKQITLGLCIIHQAGYIHRDIKPSNILLKGGEKKTVKLGDYGLAKKIVKNKDNTKNKGTFNYMAPEVIQVNIDKPDKKKRQKKDLQNTKNSENQNKEQITNNNQQVSQQNQNEGLKYNEKVDIYSLGITFIDLISNYDYKFNLDNKKFFEQKKEKETKEFRDKFLSYYKTHWNQKIDNQSIIEYIIHNTLMPDQEKRISAQDLYIYLNSDRKQQQEMEDQFKQQLQQEEEEQIQKNNDISQIIKK